MTLLTFAQLMEHAHVRGKARTPHASTRNGEANRSFPNPNLDKVEDDNMFVRTVKAKRHTYVRIVENYRERGKSHQRIIANLGNLPFQKKALVQIIEGLRRRFAHTAVEAI